MSEEKQGKNQKSLDERRLMLPDKLPGSKCRECGETFYPRRICCLKCSSQDLEDMFLETKGKLDTFTTVTMVPPGSLVEAPYSLGSIKTPEGVHIMSVLTEPDPEKLKLDMDMEMVVEQVNEDAEGNAVMAFKFKPV
jgi:uncharacterized OB-fold protein